MDDKLRVLVCGGRDFDDYGAVCATLDAISPKPACIIEGGASGADKMARMWAHLHGVEVLTYPARWYDQGKRAGPLRNQRMLDHGRPDVVIAFPGGRGTADMVRRAKAAGLPVAEVADDRA